MCIWHTLRGHILPGAISNGFIVTINGGWYGEHNQLNFFWKNSSTQKKSQNNPYTDESLKLSDWVTTDTGVC